MKKCKADGCDFPVFSTGYCQRHQYLRKDKKAKQSRERNLKRVKRLRDKKQSTHKAIKRLQKEYNDAKERFIEYKKSIGEYRCVFCGRPIEGEPDIHHLLGRDGKLLIDQKSFELAHRKCHTEYHSQPVDKLEWFDGYLERIKHFSSLYEKEKLKKKK